MAARSTHRCRIAQTLGVATLLGVLVACSDGDDPLSNATTTTTATTAPTTTTSAVTTTEAPTTTTPDTVAPTIPDGAIDLGHGVFIPVPDGWQRTDDNEGAVTLESDAVTVVVQALSRPAGENPLDVAQEYLDMYDSDFTAAAYTPLRLDGASAGEHPVQAYTLHYITYGDEDGLDLFGGLTVLVRGDGLVAIFDIYSTDEDGSTGDAYSTFFDSVVSAPALGDFVDLVDLEPQRITSVHEFVPVDGLAGFTLAPGFSVVTAEPDYVRVSNGTRDFEVYRLTDLPDVATGIEATKPLVEASYSNVTYQQPVNINMGGTDLDRQDMNWNGTYTPDGASCGGVSTVIFDRSTGNAYAIISSWYWPSAGGEPNRSESTFMFRGLNDSYETIP